MSNSSQFEKTIIGDSPQIKNVIELARSAAKSMSTTTLIMGESGTGKELVARLIHNLSQNANQPFVDINCGAIPESLLESELFGYEKGAFTGANALKKGFFELADGGTIFLDEIGNTTANFQIKLLKAVENKRFRRIAGTEEIEISTRILAATNEDLFTLVKMGKFREDLYYRLNVFQISIPSLREREGDVTIIAKYFLEYFNKVYNHDIIGFTDSSIAFLNDYHWPGNVRQLRNAIERAVLVTKNDWISEDDLFLDFGRNKQSVLNKSQKNSFDLSELMNTSKTFDFPSDGFSLDIFERKIIFSALRKTNGNLSETARLLNMKRGKLRYRIERLGITWKEIYEMKAESHSNA